MTFLNVDLEIQSPTDPATLAAEIEGKAMVLYCGPFHDDHLVNIESRLRQAAADDKINDLCNIVESLSPSSRALWRDAIRREFDAGFEAIPTHEAVTLAIPSSTLRRMASLDVSFAITIYPPDASEALRDQS